MKETQLQLASIPQSTASLLLGLYLMLDPLWAVLLQETVKLQSWKGSGPILTPPQVTYAKSVLNKCILLRVVLLLIGHLCVL